MELGSAITWNSCALLALFTEEWLEEKSPVAAVGIQADGHFYPGENWTTQEPDGHGRF